MGNGSWSILSVENLERWLLPSKGEMKRINPVQIYARFNRSATCVLRCPDDVYGQLQVNMMECDGIGSCSCLSIIRDIWHLLFVAGDAMRWPPRAAAPQPVFLDRVGCHLTFSLRIHIKQCYIQRYIQHEYCPLGNPEPTRKFDVSFKSSKVYLNLITPIWKSPLEPQISLDVSATGCHLKASTSDAFNNSLPCMDVVSVKYS